MKISGTQIFNLYIRKLLLRLAVFLFVLFFYLKDKTILLDVLKQPVFMNISSLHILWFGAMCMMINHLFPREPYTMALLKHQEKKYTPVENYNRLELLEYVQKQNIRAWRVMLAWLIGNSVVGILYSLGYLAIPDLLMLSVFYFLCDYICILFYCPFQSHIMGNKCCVNCRIYDWGHFMMFTPLLFIKNFYALSLFFTGCVVLIHWELVYAKHPERFYEGSNSSLKCANCNDKTCQLKNKLTNRKNIEKNCNQ